MSRKVFEMINENVFLVLEITWTEKLDCVRPSLGNFCQKTDKVRLDLKNRFSSGNSETKVCFNRARVNVATHASLALYTEAE